MHNRINKGINPSDVVLINMTMASKMIILYVALLSIILVVPTRSALLCPEMCKCDNENLVVECGNEGNFSFHGLQICSTGQYR